MGLQVIWLIVIELFAIELIVIPAKMEVSIQYLFCIFVQNGLIMTAIELKNVLIHRITEINDISFLEAIKTILDSKIETKVLTLTPEQREEIKASKKEIEQGLFISHDELDKEVSVWLSSK